MSQTCRKFAVEPVDQSSTSKKDASAPRRFAVEPVETLIRSSKSPRPNSPESGDLKRPPRRFAPEPIETKQTSSKDKKDAAAGKPRKFAPQPIETTQRSNRGGLEHKPQIRFKPEPLETTYGSNRKKAAADEPSAPRKFTPMLIDTASRSHRTNRTAMKQSDYKTESGHLIAAREHRRHITGKKTPAPERMDVDSDEQINPLQSIDASELRQKIFPLSGSRGPRRSMSSQRSHSFRCPELDTIESSESERNSETSAPSSPGQGSPITGSDSSYNEMYKQHATRIRESIDESFVHYLRQLEAKKAEQRLLEEAALAAFPNSDFHEPVTHFVDDDQDSEEQEIEDRPVTWEGHDADEIMEGFAAWGGRRESTAKINWEQLEMQRHAEKLEQERKAIQTTAKQPSESQTQSPWWNPASALGTKAFDSEITSMRDRARPPMLGDDIIFPRCPSPEPARFDVTQGSVALRNQMCYLSEQSQSQQTDGEGGLWQAPVKNDRPFTSIKSPAGSKSSNKGLWGGFCLEDEKSNHDGMLAPPVGPTGLMTPMVEPSANPFDQSFGTAPKKIGDTSQPVGVAEPENPHVRTPSTPPAGSTIKTGDLATIDAVLDESKNLEQRLSNDFPDSFITQVYNYLSLGYPSLARPFDEELSKISHVSIAELREDDKTARKLPRGYIRLGPDFEGQTRDEDADGVTEQTCKRWQALKLYVHEWARQESNMVPVEGPAGNWGTGARRGSWAI